MTELQTKADYLRQLVVGMWPSHELVKPLEWVWDIDNTEAVTEPGASLMVAQLESFIRVRSLYSQALHGGLAMPMNLKVDVFDRYMRWCQSNGLTPGFIKAVENLVKLYKFDQTPAYEPLLDLVSYLLHKSPRTDVMACHKLDRPVVIGVIESLISTASQRVNPFTSASEAIYQAGFEMGENLVRTIVPAVARLAH